MNSNGGNEGNHFSIALDSTSFQASVRYLDFKHTFDSDDDPQWLPLFDRIFKDLTELRISIEGNKPAAVDRFFTHLFHVCPQLKRLDVYSDQFGPSDLKSLDKANLPSGLSSLIDLKREID